MNGWQIGLIVLGSFIAVLMVQVKRGPVRWLGKGMMHVALGAILLFVFNLFAGAYDVHIPLNAVTLGVSAILGIPGILGLVCIKLFLI